MTQHSTEVQRMALAVDQEVACALQCMKDYNAEKF